MTTRDDKNNPESHRGAPDPREEYVTPEVHFIKVTVSEALMASCKGGVGSSLGAPSGCAGIEGPCVGGGS